MPAVAVFQGGSLPRKGLCSFPRVAAHSATCSSQADPAAGGLLTVTHFRAGKMEETMNWTDTVTLIGAFAGVIAALARLIVVLWGS